MASTTAAVLAELEELRAALAGDQGRPQRRAEAVKSRASAASFPSPGVWPAGSSGSERTMDRLGRALEAADEEVDAAARRSHEVHRSLLRQKDLELAELRRVADARERAADDLRRELTEARAAYERRLAAAEGDACSRDAEAGALRAEVLALRAERDALSQRLRDSDAAAAALESEAAAQAEAAAAQLEARGQELEQAAAACQRERQEKELLQIEVSELKRELDGLEGEARAARAAAKSATRQLRAEAEARQAAEAELERRRADAAFAKEAKDLEVSELRRRLRAERGVRMACERWLRAELRTREEMEALLLAVRDAAVGRPPQQPGGTRGVEVLLEGLSVARRPAAAAADAARDADACGADFRDLKQRLREDGERLKEQVAAAKALLRQRLGPGGGGSSGGGGRA